MKKLLLVLPLVIACGGAPFTDALLGPEDGGVPLRDEDAPDATPKEAGSADAGVGSSSSDAATPIDSWVAPPPDAARTCTPFGPTIFTCTLGSSTRTGEAPANVCIKGLFSPTELDVIATPTECQCLETYTCACLLDPHRNPCGNGGTHPDAGCVVTPSGGLYVTCNP
jgi:hypothetical protein